MTFVSLPQGRCGGDMPHGTGPAKQHPELWVGRARDANSSEGLIKVWQKYLSSCFLNPPFCILCNVLLLYYSYRHSILTLSKLLCSRLLTFWSTNRLFTLLGLLCSLFTEPWPSSLRSTLLHIPIIDLCFAFHFSWHVRLSSSILPKPLVLYFILF